MRRLLAAVAAWVLRVVLRRQPAVTELQQETDEGENGVDMGAHFDTGPCVRLRVCLCVQHTCAAVALRHSVELSTCVECICRRFGAEA